MTSSELAGRIALVTGSTNGIGAAIARALANVGAGVIVTGRDAQRGALVVQSISSFGGIAWFVQADLALGEESIRTLVTDATAVSGGEIDILINNAALLVFPSPTHDIDQDLIDRAFAVSVRAPFLLVGIVAPLMASRGAGSIVNIGSLNGLSDTDGLALYSATKAAIHSLTKSWAAEYGPRGVRVNAVVPGATLTEKVSIMRDLLAPVFAALPSRRGNTPEEVAEAVLFLVSDRSSNIHGALLNVDGGASAL